MITKNKILIATTNPAKKKYLEWVIENLGFDIIHLEHLKKDINIEETGKNFKESLFRAIWIKDEGAPRKFRYFKRNFCLTCESDSTV